MFATIAQGQAIEVITADDTSVVGRFMGLTYGPVRGVWGTTAKLRGTRGTFHYVLVANVAEVVTGA